VTKASQRNGQDDDAAKDKEIFLGAHLSFLETMLLATCRVKTKNK
jgi:hypothetical protein